jgi:hypothetical protein
MTAMGDRDRRAFGHLFEVAVEQGIPPAAILAYVAELTHEADPVPDPTGKLCIYAMNEEEGTIEKAMMGRDGDYVLHLGPRYELAHTNVFPKSGTTQLTVKRRPT